MANATSEVDKKGADTRFVLGRDWPNFLTGVDHNPTPTWIAEVHLRIELHDANALSELNAAVLADRKSRQLNMPRAKPLLLKALKETGRESEGNLALVNALLLHP